MTSPRWHSMAALLAMPALLVGCTASPEPTADVAPTIVAAAEESVLDAIPEEARVAAGEGEPRSAGYWVIWSSCGEDNRAETAAANGGREAGWIIMDDLLAMPGVSLGEHPVETCDEGVAILEAPIDGSLAALASQLLAAELNLQSGSEYCPAVDETVVVAHSLLAASGYSGPDASTTGDGEVEASAAELIDLLTAYNAGELCR